MGCNIISPMSAAVFLLESIALKFGFCVLSSCLDELGTWVGISNGYRGCGCQFTLYIFGKTVVYVQYFVCCLVSYFEIQNGLFAGYILGVTEPLYKFVNDVHYYGENLEA